MLKGTTYKNGLIPAMLVDTATKNSKWNNSTDEKVKDAPILNSEEEKKVSEKINSKGNENAESVRNEMIDRIDNKGMLKKVCALKLI